MGDMKDGTRLPGAMDKARPKGDRFWKAADALRRGLATGDAANATRVLPFALCFQFSVSVPRNRCRRNVAEEFVDGRFVEAVFVIGEVIADDDDAVLSERRINILASECAKHVANLFPVFREVVDDGFFVEEADRLFVEKSPKQLFA
jgi:hypothetical protein